MHNASFKNVHFSFQSYEIHINNKYIAVTGYTLDSYNLENVRETTQLMIHLDTFN